MKISKVVSSSYEFNYLYNNATRVYALALTKSTPPIYPLKSDEANATKPTEKKSDGELKVSIDFEDLEARVMALNGNSAN